ncbi:MAG: hypothetical protein P0116_13910 [Candidatus Nitrosocosmicus sp.]|nr:hypothetical protein [Candidatus Nitrosocosmicus sp.]
MNRERINEDLDPIYLNVGITESILLACIKGSSFSEIEFQIPRVISTSKAVLRKYMNYMVNNSFISYNRIRKVYLIEANGWDLLYSIYSLRESSVSDYVDLIIKVDSNNNDLEYENKRTDST